MKRHSSIRAYFDANGATPFDAFAPDAVVADEGHRHIGHAAIDAWWRFCTLRGLLFRAIVA